MTDQVQSPQAAAQMNDESYLLEVSNLKMHFPIIAAYLPA